MAPSVLTLVTLPPRALMEATFSITHLIRYTSFLRMPSVSRGPH
jgi:hypothetical protein